MEAFGANLGEGWESLTKLFTCDDSIPNHHFYHENTSLLNQVESFLIGDSDTLFDVNNCFSSFLQESSNNDVEFDHAGFFNSSITNSMSLEPTSYCNGNSTNGKFVAPILPGGKMEGILEAKSGKVETCSFSSYQSKRNYEATSTHDLDKQRAKKRPKRGKKPMYLDEDENTVGNVQSSSTGSSDETNSNVCQELTTSASESNVRTKANRSPATDPQSLYARKRREKINERLKILQNLVPNGTKVDISTMLEEVVNYVKFLQLQIKLLSSDEMWMYAPIAYNGMDIGLYRTKLCQISPSNFD